MIIRSRPNVQCSNICVLFLIHITEALQDYFSQFGDIVDAVVKTDDYGKSRCFAFVKFADPKSSRKVSIELIDDCYLGA